jgi:hypothetical protein
MNYALVVVGKSLKNVVANNINKAKIGCLFEVYFINIFLIKD